MRARIAYAARTRERPRYYANDHSRDRVPLDPREMALIDGRGAGTSLDVEGFALVEHASAVRVWDDPRSAGYRDEVIELVRGLSGADLVVVNSPGVLRFGEKHGQSGALNNSRPARFAHVDVSDATARMFAERGAPAGAKVVRYAHYNVWRVLSAPPQDVPLGVCDWGSVADGDLIAADAIFDETGKPEWSFEGLVVAWNPAHRWHWFPDMHVGEVLVFKTNDSADGVAHCVPHVAFDAQVPEETAPRSSIEMRAVAYWLE